MKLSGNACFFPMNKKRFLFCLIMILATAFYACRGKAKDDNSVSAGPAVSLHEGNEKYAVINTKESVITWKGSMEIGGNSHNGYVYVSKGELLLENGELTGGTVEVNMNTIEDDSHRSDNNLIKHLKDPDFFDVKKFPFSGIAITRVVPATDGFKNITGNLTIKGITNAVSFPARVDVKDGMVNANGRLVIDRTKWDVRYKSGKFYDLLADQVMSDSIEFNIKIVAGNN